MSKAVDPQLNYLAEAFGKGGKPDTAYYSYGKTAG